MHRQIKYTYYFLVYVLFISCEKVHTPNNSMNFPSKEYVLNETGGIYSTDILVSDFEDSQNCKDCHMNHYDEWVQSMHSYSMRDPVFFSGWKKVQNSEHFPNTGERFCIQCHSPAAFLSGKDLSSYSSIEEFNGAGLEKSIMDGVSCDVCHTMTSLSETVHSGNEIVASAVYHMYPGEGIKYGSMEEPESNSYHSSEYNPIFNRSEFCLPCHDLTMRGIEAEITFTEWNRIPGLAMSGALSCQECHMPVKSDGHHDHSFVGVDLDLSYSTGSSPLHDSVQEMLESAASLKFGYLINTLPDSINAGDSLVIPITVTSRTAHSLPSGTSFSREAWVEIIIMDESENIIYESGVVENTEDLNLLDSNLLLFTTTLLDENDEEVNTITKTYGMINNSLPAFQSRYHAYSFKLNNEITGSLFVSVRMLFRAFKPYLLSEDHSDLLQNLPIFEITSIRDTVHIHSSQ